MNGGSSPGRAGNFSLHHRVQTGSGAHPASYPMGTRDSFPGGWSGRGVNLTTHLHLVPRSRMRGAIPPLQYAFMVWCTVTAQGQVYLYPYLRKSFFSPWLRGPAWALASSSKSGWMSWRLLNNFTAQNLRYILTERGVLPLRIWHEPHIPIIVDRQLRCTDLWCSLLSWCP
jgi:hypothetical protein